MEKELRRHVAQLVKNVGLCDEDGVAVGRAITSSAAEAWNCNRANNHRGVVQCLNYLSGGRSKRDGCANQMPKMDGFVSVYVAKGVGTIGDQLSPFFLLVPQEFLSGITDDGSDCGSPLISVGSGSVPLELWWQSAKVCAHEVDAEHNELVPSPDFFARRAAIYQIGAVCRRYVHAQIVGAWFGDGLEPWIKSRVWYCTAYEQSVSATRAFVLLESLVSQGVNVLILGPDGFPMNAGVEAAYLSEEFPFGHERVLVAMLLGQRPWSLAIMQQHAVQPRPNSLIDLAEHPPRGSVCGARATSSNSPALEQEVSAHVHRKMDPAMLLQDS